MVQDAKMSPQSKSPNHLVAPLRPLIGDWQMRALVDGAVTARGRTSFSWLEGGAFVLQRADVEPPGDDVPSEWVVHSPFPVVSVIGLDDHSTTFSMLYADARGVRRVYRMTL